MRVFSSLREGGDLGKVIMGFAPLLTVSGLCVVGETAIVGNDSEESELFPS